MKKTLKQHLESIVDPVAKRKALDNIDLRYTDEQLHSLDYAIMLGVNQVSEEDKQFWRTYRESNSTVDRYKNFYTYQQVQQEIKK